MTLKNFYIKLFTKQNVGKQLHRLFIITILIPLLLAGSVIFTIFSVQLANKYENLCESKANHVRSVLVSTTIYLREIYEKLSTDETLRQLLSTDYSSAREAELAFNQYTGFTDTLKNTTTLSSIKLYADASVLKHETPFSYYHPITEDVKSLPWYRTSANTRNCFWQTTATPGKNDIVYWELNYYCHIPIPKTSSYAVLVMSVSDNYLRSLIREDEYNIYACVNDGPVFFSSDRKYGGKPFPVEITDSTGKLKKTGKISLFGKKAIASIQTLSPAETSDYLYVAVSSPKALPAIRNVRCLFLLITAFTLAISALLIYLFSEYFSARIQTLRLAMHKVARNDYEIVNSIQGDDELSATFRDLKLMVQKLKTDEARIYEAQIKEQQLSNQQQQMELKLLANQINPHFLYNTLETIRMKAFAEGNREVATAIKLLGKSMRYVLNNTKTTATTLDKELDYIKVYLAIQKMRFEERLEYSLTVDSTLDTKQCLILPLLIQPIVENAISHGLEPTGREGFISITVYQNNESLIAEVFDNGQGLTEEELLDVVAHLDTPRPNSDHGVGLYNINNRVHLYYGKQYGLRFRSSPGEGTLVILEIPLCNLTEETK